MARTLAHSIAGERPFCGCHVFVKLCVCQSWGRLSAINTSRVTIAALLEPCSGGAVLHRVADAHRFGVHRGKEGIEHSGACGCCRRCDLDCVVRGVHGANEHIATVGILFSAHASI